MKTTSPPNKVLYFLVGLLTCAIVLFATSIPVRAEASKPHPLWGNTILGNSAEPILFYQGYQASRVTTSILDYSGPEFTPITMHGFSGAPSSPVQQELDVASGDFDGDGDDDIVYIYAIPTATTNVFQIRIMVPELESESMDWSSSPYYDAGLLSRPAEAFESPSLLRIIPGQFDTSDEALEFAIGYRGLAGSTPVYRLEIWDFNDDDGDGVLDSAPTMIGTIDGPGSPETLLHSQRFDLAASDFDLDGRDEVVLAGIEQGSSTDYRRFFVSIYGVDEAGELFLRVKSSNPTQYNKEAGGDFDNESCDDCYCAGRYFDHVAVATGNMTANDAVDEIVFAVNQRDAVWDRDYTGIIGGWKYDFYAWNDARVYIFSVTTSPTESWTIGGWDNSRDLSDNYHLLENDADDRYYYYVTGTPLGLAMGDLNADGLDEFVLSYRTNIVTYGGSANVGQLWSRAVTTRSYDWDDPNRRIVSITDLDASTDSTATGADWLPEVSVMDWDSSNHIRLRAFHPTLDAAGAITGFALRGTQSINVTKTNGDVAMVCGDLDADGVRLGPPGPPKTVANVSQPLVILKQPPIHFDIFHDGSSGEDECFDLCGCYPDASGYQCDDFYATYTQTSSTDETLECISKDDFAASTTLTQSAGGKFKFLTGKAERSLTAKVGAHFEKEGRTSVSSKVTIGKDTRVNGGDQVLVTEQRFKAWEYPLIRRDGDGPDLKGHYLVLQTMGDPVASWKSSKDWPSNVDYPVESTPGNILSYRELADPASDSRIEEMWLAAPVNGVSKMDMAPVLSVTYDTLTEKSLKKEWDFGFNVKGSAEVGADLEVVSATTKMEVEASYDHSQVSTRKTKVGGQLRFEVGLGGLANTDGSYSIQPYIFRAKSGAIVLDYAVIPSWGDPQNPNFWDAYYSHLPDPALRLPRMFHEEWAWDYTYPEKEFWSPDITIEPDSVRVGDTVKISVRVHNYSFMPLTTPVDVRFYLGDPDGGRWGSDANGDFILDNVGFQPLVGTAGQSFVSTTVSGILPRDYQTVTMEWVVGYGLSGSVPNNSWIYAVIDPRGTAEIHSPLQVASNNKGFAGIIVKDGPIAVDVPQSLTRANALGQNFPNPFNPSTSIYFTLEKPGFASLKIYDRAGRVVTTLVNEELKAGRHLSQWNGRDKQGSQVASGVYFYQLKSGDFVQTRRMLLLK